MDTNSESEYDLVSDWGEPVPCDLYDNASTRSSEGSELEHERKGVYWFSIFFKFHIYYTKGAVGAVTHLFLVLFWSRIWQKSQKVEIIEAN